MLESHLNLLNRKINLRLDIFHLLQHRFLLALQLIGNSFYLLHVLANGIDLRDALVAVLVLLSRHKSAHCLLHYQSALVAILDAIFNCESRDR